MQPKEFFGWLCKSQQDATFCLFLIRNLLFLWDKNLSHSQSLIKNTYFRLAKRTFHRWKTYGSRMGNINNISSWGTIQWSFFRKHYRSIIFLVINRAYFSLSGRCLHKNQWGCYRILTFNQYPQLWVSTSTDTWKAIWLIYIKY